VAVDVSTYFQAANADAATRIKLFRLAFDAAVSSFSGRQQLYERYYSGDPVRLAGTLYGLYDKTAYIDRIFEMLDDLESRQQERKFSNPRPGEG
jgi:4-hydroxyphenylacetate 3-monooxygenase